VPFKKKKTKVRRRATSLPLNDNINFDPGLSSSEPAHNVNSNTTIENFSVTHRIPCNCNECTHANV
jgi:hypothetical protein